MRMLRALRAVLYETAVCGIWIVLNGLDVVCNVVAYVYATLIPNNNNNNTGPTAARVVIVGASFAGLATEQGLWLHSNTNIEITVVDTKSYFEYVPGILRCLIDPDHFRRALSFDFGTVFAGSKTKFVRGTVVNILPHQVELEDHTILPFDYLVVATGSHYDKGLSLLKATPASRQERFGQWQHAAAELRQAETIVIVGAGAVGVELAGEILTAYPQNKRLVLVDMAPQILTGFPEATARYCTDWLQRHGAELYLGAPLQQLSDRSITLQNGTTIAADIVYKCIGGGPQTSFLKTSPLAAALDDKGALLVNDHLQVQGFDHIFSAGDACFHAVSQEVKLGHTAEQNAHLVAANILRLVDASRNDNNNDNDNEPLPQRLLRYPHDVVGNHTTPFIYDVSLGPYEASLGMNALQLHGLLPAIVKWLLEYTKVAAAQKRWIGIIFWIVADRVSNWLGRTWLPTAARNAKKPALVKKRS